MAEAIPAGQQECRLVKERGLYWLVVPHPAQCDIETPSGDGVVALDVLFRPPAASSATTPSGAHASATGSTTFSRTEEPNRRKRRQMRTGANAAANNEPGGRAPLATGSLVDQQLPDHPATNFRDPDLTQRAGRKIRSKTARMMLTFRHYEFKRLQWKPGARRLVRDARRTPARPAAGTVP